jgi:hypothetical protein
MSLQALVDFWKIMEDDNALRQSASSVSAGDLPAHLVELGAAKGLVFSEDEVRELIAEDYMRETNWISDSELDSFDPPSPPLPCLPSGIGALAYMKLNINMLKSGQES